MLCPGTNGVSALSEYEVEFTLNITDPTISQGQTELFVLYAEFDIVDYKNRNRTLGIPRFLLFFPLLTHSFI
jgi:hypothetical protein